MSARPAPVRAVRGYTLLELLLAMTIFLFLGAMVVFLMRQALNVFTTASTGSALIDRVETVLPEIQRDLERLALPADWRPPYVPPETEDSASGPRTDRPMAPPVAVRLRSGWIVLKGVAEGPLKDVPCFYAAWVVDVTGDRTDPLFREAGETAGPGLQAMDVSSKEGGAYLPTGGRLEVCYVAVPEDPSTPGVLTLYRGWRSPVGGTKSLLDPANVDSLEKIHGACRAIETGVLHFSITWRRVFATDWTPTAGAGAIAETDPYVGPVWDSTRALDTKWGLHRGAVSLADPSDDIFPQWARVEMTLVRQRSVGGARAETELASDAGLDDGSILLADAGVLKTEDGEHFLKIDSEWMGYRPSGVDPVTGKAYVDRGVRGSVRAGHEAGAEVFTGLEARKDVRLLFRDRYAR